jgi:hypothetical protein
MQFFKKREELKLQLREMALQVESKKVDFKRRKMVARQPLQPLLNNAKKIACDEGKAAARPDTPNPTRCMSPPPGAQVGATGTVPQSSSVALSESLPQQQHESKFPPMSRDYAPLTGDFSISKGKEAYANLRALPIGTKVDAEFTPRFFRAIPSLHGDEGITELLAHGTDRQWWSVSVIEDNVVRLAPVTYKFPGTQYKNCPVTESSFLNSQVVIQDLLSKKKRWTSVVQ